MFSETLTITIDGVAKALNRINQDGYASEYLLRESAGEYRLKIRNSSFVDKTRGVTVDRHGVDFTHTVYGVAPAPNTVRHSYMVIENDHPDAVSSIEDFNLGYVAFFSSANILKLLNFES